MSKEVCKKPPLCSAGNMRLVKLATIITPPAKDRFRFTPTGTFLKNIATALPADVPASKSSEFSQISLIFYPAWCCEKGYHNYYPTHDYYKFSKRKLTLSLSVKGAKFLEQLCELLTGY
jgi:hypothetical protein